MGSIPRPLHPRPTFFPPPSWLGGATLRMAARMRHFPPSEGRARSRAATSLPARPAFDLSQLVHHVSDVFDPHLTSPGLRPISSLLILTGVETKHALVSAMREEPGKQAKPGSCWLWGARARTPVRTPANGRRGGRLVPGLALRRARGTRTQQVGLRRQLWELRRCVSEVPDVCGSRSATLRLSPQSRCQLLKTKRRQLWEFAAHRWLLPTPPSFPTQPRASLGARRLRGRRQRRLPVCGGESCAPALLRRRALQGPRELGARPSRQPVGAASVREVSGLRQQSLLQLHHVRGRRLRESAEEIQAGVPGGAER